MSDHHKSVISLFSGAGGFDLGFHLAGFQTYLACELLPEPAKTIAHNFKLETVQAPATPFVNGHRMVVQGDVRTVDFSNVTFSPDVLIGGPPCQDFSSVKGGKQLGVQGTRGRLYLEFMRAVIQLKPKVFVFENVPGLMSANGGEAHRIIRNDLSQLNNPARLREICQEMSLDTSAPSEHPGYDILFDEIIDAPNLGVPQTRRRLIMVGIRRDLIEKYHILQQRQLQDEFARKLHGKHKLFRTFPLTVLETFEGKPLPDLQMRYAEIMAAYKDLAIEQSIPAAAEWRTRFWDKLKFDIKHDYFVANNIEDTSFRKKQYDTAMLEHEELLREMQWKGRPVSGTDMEETAVEDLKTTQGVVERMYNIPPDENYKFVDGTKWQVEGKGISFIYRRSAPLKPAWTVVAYGGGGTHGYHYDRNRSQLSLRERARIQTFTDDYRFMGPGIRAQIGEAVPPLMAKRIAQAVDHLLQVI